jgi:putative endonuclease
MIYVYVLRSSRDGYLYTGCSRDLQGRFELHNAGKVPSTRNRRPLELIYYEASLNEQLQKLFHRLKKLRGLVPKLSSSRN